MNKRRSGFCVGKLSFHVCMLPNLEFFLKQHEFGDAYYKKVPATSVWRTRRFILPDSAAGDGNKARLRWNGALALNNTEGKMNIIISLIIYLVVFGLIWWLISMLPLPAPVAQIVRILFIILLILMVLSAVGILPGGYLPQIRL